MTITESAINKTLREARTSDEDKKLTDGKGLYLLVRPNGSAAWRHKFNFGGKELLDTLARYPETSIKEARRLHQANRSLLDAGINPMEKKREAKRAASDTFGEFASNYLTAQEGKLAPDTLEKRRWQLDFVLPHIGTTPIKAVRPKDLLAALREVEKRGLCGETVHDIKQLCGRVFDFAIAEDRADFNPAQSITKALKPHVESHLAAVTKPAEIGSLLRAIDGFVGQPATLAALRLLPHVFLRPGELRHGRWAEIDFAVAQWVVPAERMKGKREHIVPLSKQALAILKALKPITGEGEYMFPAIGPKRRPISENTLGAALRSIGYDSNTMVPHGFRTMASTRLHELGYPSADIELQLAHRDKNKIRGIYNRAERLKERTRVMQEWSNHLDALRIGDNVVTITQRRA
jgi:integrase